MKRLFIAIHLHPEPSLRALFALLKQNLAFERIHWTNLEQLHLTLKFIGGTSENQVKPISEALMKAVQGTSSFQVAFDKLGLFGSQYDPRVLWIGQSVVSNELLILAEKVLLAMDEIGFQRDRQNFVPHLTLGRIKSLTDKAHFQQLISANSFGDFHTERVQNIVLYESILCHDGPVYHELFSVRLTL